MTIHIINICLAIGIGYLANSSRRTTLLLLFFLFLFLAGINKTIHIGELIERAALSNIEVCFLGIEILIGQYIGKIIYQNRKK